LNPIDLKLLRTFLSSYPHQKLWACIFIVVGWFEYTSITMSKSTVSSKKIIQVLQ